MTLRDKTILLTGGSSGIGKSIAQLLHEKGAKLIFVGRNLESCKISAQHQTIQADLLHRPDLDSVIESLKHTPLDAILNIAGIGIYKTLTTISEDEFRRSLELNTIVPFLLTKSLLHNLYTSELSLVLTIGSLSGVNPMAERVAYTTSKFATRGMMLSLAEEYKESKPTFCLISLGSTITTFGGKSVPKQIREVKTGVKPAFPVEWVAARIVESMEDETRPAEVILDPTEFEPHELLGE